MRVAAQLSREPGARQPRQVCRHDQRAAAEEGERRRQHPPVADRDQLGHPRECLLLQQRDRVAARVEVDLGVRGP